MLVSAFHHDIQLFFGNKNRNTMSGVATKIGQWADFTDQPLLFSVL